MTRHYKLTDIDCANCAAKIEAKIQKIKGVESASVVFLSQKVTISADESEFDRIYAEAVKAVKNVEPDCELVEL